jgi:ABC-type dipeptide/oligopeptide/nickel transport system permease component
MTAFLIRRLVQSVLVLLGVSIFVFGLLQISGDPTGLLLAPDATPEDHQRLRERLGFDRPIYVQYASYMQGVVQGDFGESIRSGQPALGLVLERMPATIQLGVAAMVLAIVVAFPVGIIAALNRGRLIDRALMSLALFGQSIPVFFLGIVLILIFGVKLGWFPVAGRGGLDHLVMPMVTLGLFSMARTARLVRSGMLEVMSTEYVTTARAKGLRESTIVTRHALKNALIPIITVLGLDLATLLGGAVITETIFSWPGVGRLIIFSISARDYPVVQAAVFVIALTYIFINLAVDILYVYLNPRVRYG